MTSVDINSVFELYSTSQWRDSSMEQMTMYCIVSIHLYSASCSAHQSEALPVRETQREESRRELM